MAEKTRLMKKRVDAAQATVDRFQGKPFKLGRFDCAQMVAFHLRRIGRPVKVQKAGTYHSALGAKKALKRLGFDNLTQVADATFPRIPWAAALAGDIVEIPQDDAGGGEGIGALGVVVGNGRVLVYHPDAAGAVVGELKEANAAWRVIPNPGE